MPDKEKWLKDNTFVCPHGLGRISPKQCEANRKRPRLKEIGRWTNPNIFPMPGPCENCTEWKVLCQEQEVDKRKEKIMAESKKIVICAECGRRKIQFQFLIGRLKTETAMTQFNLKVGEFQFLIGRLKT